MRSGRAGRGRSKQANPNTVHLGGTEHRLRGLSSRTKGRLVDRRQKNDRLSHAVSQRRASLAPAAGFGVTTTGTTTTLSSYLTVILAFPAATPETPPSLVTVATVGRSDV